jgi:hypothetical protein
MFKKSFISLSHFANERNMHAEPSPVKSKIRSTDRAIARIQATQAKITGGLAAFFDCVQGATVARFNDSAVCRNLSTDALKPLESLRTGEQNYALNGERSEQLPGSERPGLLQ